jgi:hypothetical protein
VVHQRLQQLDDELRVAQEVTVVHKHLPQQRPELQAALNTFHWQSSSAFYVDVNLQLLQRSSHFYRSIPNRHNAVANNT